MNVGTKEYCYGCGVCANACRREAITIALNEDGFYTPIVDASLCNDCGMCLKVCSHNDEKISVEAENKRGYAAWSNDEVLRKESSSGGVVGEICKSFIAEGYKICAVRYNASLQRAEHYIINTEDDIAESRGSKYIQSYTVEGISDMLKTDRFVFIGTPCQVDSLRRLLRIKGEENKCIFIDFFCHGVPSYNLWKKYSAEASESIGEIKSVSWRDKIKGWHSYCAMHLVGSRGDWHIRRGDGDVFYRFFLNNVCLNKACYKDCKYKGDNSAADIRVGDLWGERYKDDEDGVSGIITFDAIGERVLHSADVTTIQHDLATVMEGQHKCPPAVDYALREEVMRLLRNEKLSMSAVNRRFSIIKRKYKYIGIIKRLFGKR